MTISHTTSDIRQRDVNRSTAAKEYRRQLRDGTYAKIGINRLDVITDRVFADAELRGDGFTALTTEQV